MVGLRFNLLILMVFLLGLTELKAATFELISPLLNNKKIHSSLGFEQSQYLGPAPSSDQDNSLNYMKGRFLGNFGDQKWSSSMNFSGQLALEEGQEHYVWVHEAEMTYQPVEGWWFTLGRKMQPWSMLDLTWELGLWQPQVTVDPLNPDTSGLVGLFAERRWSKDMRALVWISPFYIPNDGTRFSILEGRIQSDSRWFPLPPNHLELFSGRSEILYELKRPDTWSIVDHGGVAANLGYRALSGQGFWVQSSYAFKPSQQLYLALEPQQNITVTQVNVIPLVFYQHLIAMDMGMRWEKANTYISLGYEKPEEVVLTERWLGIDLYQSYFVGATWDQTWSFARLRTLLSYMKRFESGESVVRREEGPLSSVGGEQIRRAIRRYRFDEAIQLIAKSEVIRHANQSLSVLGKWTLSVADQGWVFSPEINFKPEPNWEFYVQADILTSPQADDEELGEIAKYRSNDRVLGGFRYVF